MPALFKTRLSAGCCSEQEMQQRDVFPPLPNKTKHSPAVSFVHSWLRTHRGVIPVKEESSCVLCLCIQQHKAGGGDTGSKHRL